MGFIEAIKTVIKKSFVIKGRASRSEFWRWPLFVWAIFPICLCFIIGIPFFQHPIGVLFILVFGSPFAISFSLLLTIIPTTTVSIRRMHDIGKSGWWCLLELISKLITIDLWLIKNIGSDMKKLFPFLDIHLPKGIQTLLLLCCLIFLIIYIFDSQAGNNQYGKNPNPQSEIADNNE